MGVNFREAKTRSAGEKRWEERHKEIDWPVGAASSRDDLSSAKHGEHGGHRSATVSQARA